MTPEEFRKHLAILAWSQHDLATLIGVHVNSVNRWVTGRGRVPESVAEWLTIMSEFMQQTAPPDLINRWGQTINWKLHRAKLAQEKQRNKHKPAILTESHTNYHAPVPVERATPDDARLSRPLYRPPGGS